MKKTNPSPLLSALTPAQWLLRLGLFLMLLLLFANLDGVEKQYVRAKETLDRYLWLEQDLAQLENDYGVRLRADLAPADYPPSWLDDDTGDMTVTIVHDGQPVDTSTKIVATGEGADFTRFVRILKPEIERYAPALIRQHLSHIYCLDTMTLHGAAASGTYSRELSSLYVVGTVSNPIKQRSAIRIKKTFHHEFSSILMQHYNFDERAWRQAAGEGFRYKGDDDPLFYWMFISDHLDAPPPPEEVLFQRGLLSHYGETGVENDFNVYAATIFTEPKRMKTLIATYPIIARKYALFKIFYLGIDPGLAPVFAAIDE
ncbi:MAG: hypothetical protein GXP14_02385 [Gammaproteobacteria bacterium]|nr:hypothetical protein [Gammaproteobacteria bacterium]